MRKIALLAAFAAVTGATTVFAQNGGPPGGAGRGRGPGGGGMMMDRVLLEGITLTDSQQAKLQELRKAERERAEAQRGQQQGPPPEMQAIREAREKGDTATANKLMAEQRAKMVERRDAQIAATRAILSSDQLAQFDANVAELKKRESEMGGMGMGRGRRGGPPGR
jgi:Spy/CpxP family protein refolding chaperone